jgi:hypothetical protein
VPDYLVETYLGRGDDFAAAAALADAVSDDAACVQHLRSTYIGEDEVCLHWFAAPSLEAVRAAAARAQLEFDRIVAADTAEQRGKE